jgi:hypothetical protein
VPGFFVAQPEIGREVDDPRPGEPLRQGGRLAVREGHEDQFRVAEDGRVGGLEVSPVEGRVSREVLVD